MDILSIFQDFEVVNIAKYMTGELLIGIAIGLLVKYISKIKSGKETETQVFPVNEYSSKYFGKNYPTVWFGMIFPLEFAIVKYSGEAIVSEQLFSFLGDSIKLEFADSKFQRFVWSALASPMYSCTAVAPICLGFFLSLIPVLDKIGSSLLLSGLIWIFIYILIPMLPKFQNPEKN